MTVLRIGYALLLLTVLGLDAFCGSILSAAATALLVLTPLACVPLHLRAAKKLRVRLDAPVNLAASFFLDWRTKHRAVKMLRNREIDILGSDCHGVSYRPPRLDEAAKFICRHAGNEALSRLEDCSRKLIGTDR